MQWGKGQTSTNGRGEEKDKPEEKNEVRPSFYDVLTQWIKNLSVRFETNFSNKEKVANGTTRKILNFGIKMPSSSGRTCIGGTKEATENLSHAVNPKLLFKVFNIFLNLQSQKAKGPINREPPIQQQKWKKKIINHVFNWGLISRIHTVPKNFKNLKKNDQGI